MPKMTVAQKREFLVEMCNCREYLKTDVELNKAVLKKHLKFLPQQKLYKFRACIEREFRMLEENCIWMSLASSFPDPFDHTINIDLVKNRREVKEWLGKNGSSLCFEVVKRLFEEKGLAIPYTFSDFEDYMKTCLDENGIPIKDRERAFLAAHATPDELSQMDSIIQQLVCARKRFAGIEEQMTILTHAQVREIVLNCAENLEGNHGYLYFGLILMLTTGITISELCALTWGSFSTSNAYTGVTVIEIGSEAKRVGDVYHIEKLNWPRRRTLPLPPTMAKLYHKVKNNAPNVQENAPFMHSFKNAARRMRPDEVEKWLKGFFKSFDFSKQSELKSLTKNPERTLRATFRSALESCGCDEEEIRYLCGNAPKSVFARNYCAYDDPRELAKLAAVVEHYIFSLMSASDTALDFKINRSGEDYAIAAAPGSRISGDLTVDLSKISHDNLEAGRDLIIEFKSSDSVFVTTELDLEEN